MKLSSTLQVVVFLLVTLIIISALSALAAGLTVSESNVGRESIPVMADDLKPSECAGLFLTQVVSGSGTLMGTGGNDLILGSPMADVIDGLGGDDCILGGGGDDDLIGNDGVDICLGGPGSDTFNACEAESQ